MNYIAKNSSTLIAYNAITLDKEIAQSSKEGHLIEIEGELLFTKVPPRLLFAFINNSQR